MLNIWHFFNVLFEHLQTNKDWMIDNAQFHVAAATQEVIDSFWSPSLESRPFTQWFPSFPKVEGDFGLSSLGQWQKAWVSSQISMTKELYNPSANMISALKNNYGNYAEK